MNEPSSDQQNMPSQKCVSALIKDKHVLAQPPKLSAKNTDAETMQLSTKFSGADHLADLAVPFFLYGGAWADVVPKVSANDLGAEMFYLSARSWPFVIN